MKEAAGKRILLTGAAGFIGARTAALLLEAGAFVRGLDNLNDYYDPKIKLHRLQTLQGHSSFRFSPVDIEDFAALAEIFDEGPWDAVVNLAARAGVRHSLVDPFVYVRCNVLGTVNLLELMRQHGVRKAVLASSSSLYAGQETPFREDLPTERPLSPYAASKKAMEVMAYPFHQIYGIDVSILRYFTVYGPAGRPDMALFRFIQQIDRGQPVAIFGDGTQRRDFTYVDDIARGTILALRPVGFEIFNLGRSNAPVALSRVLALIESALGKLAVVQRHPPSPADVAETWADISKARNLLSWEPKISIEEGIRRCVDWHRAQGPWLREIAL